MNPKIQKVNLQNLDDMQISFSSSNPFENLEYVSAIDLGSLFIVFFDLQTQ